MEWLCTVAGGLVAALVVYVLLSGGTAKPLPICAFCDQDKHVHDVLTGQCINRECRCEVGR